MTFYFLKKKKKITLNIHSHQAEENPGLRKSKWTEASWVTGESPGETKVEKLKKVQLFSRIRLIKHVTHSAYTVNTNGLQGTFSIHSADTKATLLLWSRLAYRR